jgi:hypothetical protein
MFPPHRKNHLCIIGIFSLLSIIRNISARNIKNLQENVGFWVLFQKNWVKSKKIWNSAAIFTEGTPDFSK